MYDVAKPSLHVRQATKHSNKDIVVMQKSEDPLCAFCEAGCQDADAVSVGLGSIFPCY